MTSPGPRPDRKQLAADVDAFEHDLAALPRSEAIDKAIYHTKRLGVAIRSSHSEGTRFAAFTVAKIVRDQASAIPAEVVARMEAIRRALEASGLDLGK